MFMATPKYIQKSISIPSISTDVLARLETIFQDKHWQIDTSAQVSLYDRYCVTLSKFTPEEQHFLLDLTERFLKIDIDDYVAYFEDIAYSIRCEHPNLPLLLAPCLPEKDISSNKSAKMALYLMRSTSYKHVIGQCRIELNDIKNSAYFVKPDTIVVLVDDFIGTGDTAIGAIEYARKCLPKDFPTDHIKLMSIAAMEMGIEKISKLGINVYTHYLINKGITDKYKGESLEKAIGLMTSIESKLKVKPKFHFGYKQSEALISMCRCPNNTFPVYWLGKNTAPYER